MLTRLPVRFVPLLFVALFVACGAPPVPGVDGGHDAGPDVGATDGGLDLNDVSWLFPLPTVPGDLLSLDSAGPRGALLPRALYDGLPAMLPGGDAGVHDDFRVIGARVDPCFPTDAQNSGCRRQIRLVAQPVTYASLLPTTEDATIHLFFDLSEADWADVQATVDELHALAAGATRAKALDVHPVLKTQGLRSAYALKLKDLITRLCGAQTLTRVAFMRLVQADVAWSFGAFNVSNGALVDDTIPRLDTLSVQGVQEFGNDAFRNGDLQPAAPGDQLVTLLSESELRLTDARTLQKAITSALRIENPHLESPKTIDCGSCHVASRALSNARVERNVDTSGYAEQFTAAPRFNLSRVDAVGNDPRAMRAFGYFGSQSALSQRTINESAIIAAEMTR